MDGLIANDGKYRSCPLIANWYEELCVAEEDINGYLEKRNNNQLLVQKIIKLHVNLLKAVELHPATDYVRFGATVQFVAIDMKHSENYDLLPALSISVSGKHINKSQTINKDSLVTIAPSMNPCVRNTFIIASPAETIHCSETLKYGQEFMIQSTGTEDNVELVVYFSPNSCDFANVTDASNGRTNLGLCTKYIPGLNNSHEIPLIRSGHCRWKCQHLNRESRYESEGQPVPSNSRLVITHCATNQHLAAQNVQFETFFGKECVASVHSYINQHKRETWQNVWQIHVENPEILCEESS